jgi:hypothetical protein
MTSNSKEKVRNDTSKLAPGRALSNTAMNKSTRFLNYDKHFLTN